MSALAQTLISSDRRGFRVSESEFTNWLTGAPLRVIGVFLAAFLAAELLRRFVKRAVSTAAKAPNLLRRGDNAELAIARAEQRAKAVGSLLTSSIVFAVWAVALMIALDQIGIDVAPLIASAGVVGVAIGLGAQTIVKDYLAGIFMVIEDQYGVGDVVSLGDVSGTVEEVRLRVTRIKSDDGTIWYVRNGELTKVGNKSQSSVQAQ